MYETAAHDPPAPETLLLRVVTAGACHDAAIELLASDGVPAAHVRAWADQGDLYTLGDPALCPGEGAVGAAVVTPSGAAPTVELRLLAVAPGHRGEGMGRRLLNDVGDVLRARGVRRLVASASNVDLGRMALFQKTGFQFAHDEHDLLWFDLEL